MMRSAGPCLVIRSARPEVLRDFLENVTGPVTVLGPPGEIGFAGDRLETPPGPMLWRSFSPELRARLTTGDWSRIVILHNRGSDYLRIYDLARRINPKVPVTVFYKDHFSEAVEEHHPDARALVRSHRFRSVWEVVVLLPLFCVLLIFFWVRAWFRSERYFSSLRKNAA